MAVRTETITYRTDDLDGTDLGRDAGETVSFAFKGEFYEIDLSDKNAKVMQDALGQFITKARKMPARRGRGRRAAGTHTATAAPAETKAARAWLIAQGVLSPDSRGRISAENWERYRSREQTSIDVPAERVPSLAETKGEVPAASRTTSSTTAAQGEVPAKPAAAGTAGTGKDAPQGNSRKPEKAAPKVTTPETPAKTGA